MGGTSPASFPAGGEGVELLMPPLTLGILIVVVVTLTLAFYLAAIKLAWRRALSTAHRGERAWSRHHTALLVHLFVLDCCSVLMLAPLELSSLSAHGAWWQLPRSDVLCRAALGLDTFLATASVYGVAALGLHATSCEQQTSVTTAGSSFISCLRIPLALPLIWTIAALLSAPPSVLGQLVSYPEGLRCALILPPPPLSSWDRLLLALLRAVFSLAIPLVLMVTCAVRALIRMFDATSCRRLHVVVFLWSLSYVLVSMPRFVLATVFSFRQALTEYPTHLTPPFTSITSSLVTFICAAMYYVMCALRPSFYYVTIKIPLCYKQNK